MNLSPKQLEALRVAVAEIAGAKRIDRPEGITLCNAGHAADQIKWGALESNAPVEFIFDQVPNYPYSLDATQEIITALNANEISAVAQDLTSICWADGNYACFATAPQLCIAIVMTMAPEKWEEIKRMEESS